MTLALKTILTNLRQSCLRRSRWKMAAHWGVIPCLILGIASFSAFARETGFMSSSDLNGDLLSDLAIMDENGNGILLENQGSGTLKPVDSFYAHSKNVGKLSLIDFSKDGSMDLLLLYPHDSGIEWVPGTAFDQNQSSFLTGFGVEPISLDASRSNISVAAVGYEQTAKISLLKVNSQSSTLEWVQEWNTDYPVPDLIWVDLDGDGFDELVTLQKKNETTAILTAFDQASMDIQSPWIGTLLSQWETSVLDHVVSGQFTPDSLPDLLVWSSGKDAFLVIATGNNVFETKAVTLEESSMIEIGDLNQDGLDDIVLVSPEGDAVNVYLNGGDASFQSHAFPGVSGNVVGVAIGSFTTANQKDVFLWTSASDANGKLSDPNSVSPQSLNTASLSLYQFLNGNVEKIGEADLPTLGKEDAVFQNVVIYKKSDLDQGRYFPYRSYFVEDWTTGASAINAGQVDVKHEILQDGALVAAPDVTLGGLDFLVNFADYEAHTNQMNAQESEFLFGKPVLPRSLRMEAAPPSGSYHLPVVVTPSSDTGASLFYRIDGGSWQSYVEGSTEIILTEDTVVSFYASLGSLLSPVIDMNYQVSIPPHSDSDVDEIPDLLEMAFGLPIYSATKDLDNDGWYDLDELVRATDPKNKTNFPVDSDLDGWSDIDEALRQTNPADPTSHPVVSGLTDGEFLLYLGSTLKTTPNDDAAIVSDGSILDVRNFTNNRIASATFTNTQWSLRLPGNDPLWLRIRDKNANTVVLTYYAASHLPCWLPLQMFDGSQTSDQWITLLQQQAASEVLEQRVDSITTRSLAASLALQIWLLQETGKTQPIAWGDGGQGFTPDELETVKAEYDLDTVYQYLFTTLEDGNPWVTLVKQFLESTRSAPLAQDWDLTLQQWALGIAVDPTLLPSSITPDAYTLAQANLTALFAGIPDRIVELTGTILIENGQTILQDGDGKNWVVDFGGLNLQTGTPITIRGLQEKLCSKGDDIVIHVQEALDYQPTVVFNTDDTDNDNLPDQWEEYFFASLSANPSDDPDNDGADNSSELIAYTSPIDSDSVPNVTPTPTVTPLPEATPTVTPLPEPTATPTPLPGLSKPTPVISYNFTQTSFADAGLSEIPGGFTGGYPAGESSMGDIPVDANAGVTDGKGLIFTCDPGEVQLVISLPTVNVGPHPVLIRCKAMATSSQGRFALAAVDGSLDNSVISLIPSDTQHLLNQYKQISLIYEPTASQTVSAVVQLYTPDTSSEAVIVYVDDLEIIPLTTGTAIVQSDVSLAIDITNDGNVTETEKPIVSQVYSFQANDLLSNGYVEIAGGFEPGAIPGQIQLSGTPFGWTPLSSDGRGVLMSCDPGETAMIMASPALTVGNQPVILRAYVRANSPEGAFALVALDGSLDGSLTSLIPGNTAFMQNQFTRISILYEPTKTDTLAPLMQLHVPSSALGPVSVFIDQLEVIPFIPNTYIEPEDIGMD